MAKKNDSDTKITGTGRGSDKSMTSLMSASGSENNNSTEKENGDKDPECVEAAMTDQVIGRIYRLSSGSGKTNKRCIYGQVNSKNQNLLEEIQKKVSEKYKVSEDDGLLVESAEDADPPMAKITGLKSAVIEEEPLSCSDDLVLPTDGTWLNGECPHRDEDGTIVNSNAIYIPGETCESACAEVKEDQLIRKFKRDHHRNPDDKELAQIKEIASKTAKKGIPYNNCVPDLDVYSHGSAKIPYFTTDRKLNFFQARAIIAAKLNKQYGGKVDEYGNPIMKDGKQVQYTAKDVEKYCQKHNLILHEEGDCMTLDKVSGKLHNTSVLRHRGGYSNNKSRANNVFGLNPTSTDGNDLNIKNPNPLKK